VWRASWQKVTRWSAEIVEGLAIHLLFFILAIVFLCLFVLFFFYIKKRHLHEECDGGDNYVANGRCVDCKRHCRNGRDGEEEEEEGKDEDDEGLVGAVDLDGEHFDEDNEELSSESGQ
jgi:hypothetical protein